MSRNSKRILSLLLALIMMFGLFSPSSGFGATASAAQDSDGTQLETLFTAEQLEAYSLIDRSNRQSGLVGFEGDYELGDDDEPISVIVEFIHEPPLVQQAEAAVSNATLSSMSSFNLAQATVLAEADHVNFQSEMNEMFGYNPYSRIAAPFEVTSSYKDALNGVAVTMPANMVTEMAKLDTVYAVYPDVVITIDPGESVTDVSDEMLGLSASRDYLDIEYIHEDLEATGDGIVVGVLDTGVDYNHPDLKGAFSTSYSGSGDLQPYNGKYYGRNFVKNSVAGISGLADHDAFNPMETTYAEWQSVSGTYSEKSDTYDFYTAHGTHVSGTIAGRGVNMPISTLGVAPGATLLAYRVLGPYGSGQTEWVLSALDVVYYDGCDVVNMSLGATVNSPAYATSLAVNNLIVAHPNMVFCLAAGNAGSSAATVGSPGTSSLAITVGNGTLPTTDYELTAAGGTETAEMRLLASDYGDAASHGDGSWSLATDLSDCKLVLITAVDSESTATIKGTIVGNGTETEFAAMESAVAGKIAVVYRGQAFDTTAQLAKTYGAAAVIVVTNEDGEIYSFQGESHKYVPLFLTTNKTAAIAMVEDALTNSDGGIETSDYKETTNASVELNNTSSRGPVGGTMDIKPDIVAPGTTILATVPYYMTTSGSKTTSNASDAYDYAYANMSGTSMATPHIAGIAALMLEYSRDISQTWNYAEIKARMMNTADEMSGYSVHEVGAGYVNPKAAMEADAYVTVDYTRVLTSDANGNVDAEYSSGETASLNFGTLFIGRDDEQSVTLKATVYNNSSGSKTFDVTYDKNHTGFAISGQGSMIATETMWDNSEVDLEFDSSPITVSGNDDEEFEITLTVNGTGLEKDSIGIYEGYVTLTNGGEVYALPFSVYIASDDFFGFAFLNQPMITTNSVQLVDGEDDSVYIAYNPNSVHTSDSLYADIYLTLNQSLTYIDIVVAESDITDPKDTSKYLGYAAFPEATTSYTAGTGIIWRFKDIIKPAYYKPSAVGSDIYVPAVYTPGHYKLIIIGYDSNYSPQYCPTMLDLYVDNMLPTLTVSGLSSENVLSYSDLSIQSTTITGKITDSGLTYASNNGIEYLIYDSPSDYHSSTPDQALNAIFAQVSGSKDYVKAEIDKDGNFTLNLTGLSTTGTTEVTLYYLDSFSVKQFESSTKRATGFDPDLPSLSNFYGSPYAFVGLNKGAKTITLQHNGASLSMSPTSAQLDPGGTLQLSATFNAKATSAGYNAITWTSSDTNVATVSETGLVTAKKSGTVTITATSNNLGSGALTATVRISVTGVNDGVSIPVGSTVAFGAGEYEDYTIDVSNQTTPVSGTSTYGFDDDFGSPVTRFAHMWTVMGEETRGGAGDGYLTLLSRYAIKTLDYNSGSSYSAYESSDLRDYLNEEFLDDFSNSEQGAIPEVDVVTNGLSDSAKVYVPWGIDADSSSSLADSVFWSAGDEALFANSLRGDSVYKNITRYINSEKILRAAYYLRNGDDANDEIRVVNGENGAVVTRDGWDFYGKGFQWDGSSYGGVEIGVGVRPVTKLDMSSVVYAYEIPNDGATTIFSDREGYAYGSVELAPGYKLLDFSAYPISGTTYKLSVLGGDNGADVGTLTGVPTATQTIEAGHKLNLGGVSSSETVDGDDYIVAYKIVGDVNGERTIIYYGELESFSGAATLYTNELDPGSYTVYIWLQKFNRVNSYEAGTVEKFNLTVEPVAAADVGDGVSLPVGSFVYYGSYDQLLYTLEMGGMSIPAQNGFATPILWQVMGEEQDARGKGDGYLTIMSRYVLDNKAYTDNPYLKFYIDYTPWYNPEVTTISYENVAMNLFLNREFSDGFSDAEYNGIPFVTVDRTDYYVDELVGSLASRSSVSNQKVYLPWGTKYTTGSQSQWYSTVRSVFWSAGDNTSISANALAYKYNENNGIPSDVKGSRRNSAEEIVDVLLGYGMINQDTADGLLGILEAYGEDMFYSYLPMLTGGVGVAAPSYWLSAASSGIGLQYIRSDGTFYQGGQVGIGGSANTGPDYVIPTNNGGIRPITKLIPESIVYAAEVGTGLEVEPDGTNYIEPNDGETYYKLTVLGTNNGNGVGTLSGIPSGISIRPSESVTLANVASSVYGGDYTIAYKIVGNGSGGREIVLYEDTIETLAEAQSLEIDTSELPAGTYKAYFWLQKNNATSSNEAGVVAVATLSVANPTTATTYTITATAGKGGSISPATATVARGGSQTFTIKADESYAIADVLVDGVSVGKVSSYTFSNVTEKHTIEAVFEEKTTESKGFIDVPSDAWYSEAVDFVVDYGLFNGVSETRFAPNENMTRAQFVTVLGRLAELLGINTGGYDCSFIDVKDGEWYTQYVAWGSANDIVKGYGDRFGPEDSITREQMAALFVRFAEYAVIELNNSITVSFSDMGEVSAWAKDAVAIAAAAGLMQGSDGKFDPQGTATRAQVAQVFMNMVQKYITE